MDDRPERGEEVGPGRPPSIGELRAAGRFIDALAGTEDAVVEALDSGDPERVGAARIEAALVAGELSGPEAALARLHDIDVPDSAPVAAASLSFHFGALYRVLDEPTAALDRLDDALRRYRALGDARAEARTLVERAAVRAEIDAWGDAVADAIGAAALIGPPLAAALDPAVDMTGLAERRLAGRTLVTVSRVLQSAGLFSSTNPERPGALQALERAAAWLSGTGAEAYAALGYAHYRHVEPTVRIPAAVAALLRLPVETDPFGALRADDAGEWAALALARAGQGRLAGAALADLGRSLHRAPKRAVRVLRRAADVHRNLADHGELAADLADIAAHLAARAAADPGDDGAVSAAADAVELGLRAARRDTTAAKGRHAVLLAAAHILAGGDQNGVWLAGNSARDVTDLWGRPPGPAGEITIGLAPGVELACDVADGALTRLHQSVPVTEGLVAALAAASRRPPPVSELVELAVPATSELLEALGGLAAVAAARRHPVEGDAVADALVSLQWAAAHSHRALREVVDRALAERRWHEAAGAVARLSAANRASLFDLFVSVEVAAAVERALLGPVDAESLSGLDRLPERPPARIDELVGATSRSLGGHRSADEEEVLRRTLAGEGPGAADRIGPSVGEARRLASLAAVVGRRGCEAAALWQTAAAAWEPHSHTAALLCEWHATGQVRAEPGLAFFALEVRRRAPALAVHTWDGHVLDA